MCHISVVVMVASINVVAGGGVGIVGILTLLLSESIVVVVGCCVNHVKSSVHLVGGRPHGRWALQVELELDPKQELCVNLFLQSRETARSPFPLSASLM